MEQSKDSKRSRGSELYNDIIIPNQPEIEQVTYFNGAFDHHEDFRANGRSTPPDDYSAKFDYMEEPEDGDTNPCFKMVYSLQSRIIKLFKDHGAVIWRAVLTLFVVAFCAYFAYAIYYSFQGEPSVRLFWITVSVAVFMIIHLVKSFWGDALYRGIVKPVSGFVNRHYAIFKWGFIGIAVILYIIYIVLEVGLREYRNLQSLLGFIFLILVFFIFSDNPAKVRWRPFWWGMGLQFVIALLVLQTTWGYTAVRWLGDRATEFLAHANAGALFVFGDKYTDHFFAFSVMPVVVFVSSMTSVLYYLGVMQSVIGKLAWVMQITLGTTAAESFNAAGNIFIGQTEAPLLILPFIEHMTKSELHAVMTGGFATVAGGVLGAFILMGIPAHHLIAASVMSAPAALAMSKLSCPETEKSETSLDAVNKINREREVNVIEAASNGASASIKLVANIVANLIAFIALLEFLNQTLTWFGQRAGYGPPNNPPITFQFVCSYVFWPLAFSMGVDADSCRQVAGLLGYKLFVNEFVAYTNLGTFISNRNTYDDYMTAHPNVPPEHINDDIYLRATNVTLAGGIMTLKAETIATYALCGFANISSIGIMLGGLGAMAPSKKPILAGIALRAMITGASASFLTAATAGLLFDDGTA